MAQPRWIIASTGYEPDGESITHSILEFDRHSDTYVTIAQFFTEKAARLVYEALYWQEQLQQGLPVVPKTKAKAKESKRVKLPLTAELATASSIKSPEDEQ